MENELNINEDMTLSDDELIHWGIRGMRWGIRRYQNKDGSLTPRGQKRYNDELKKVREEEKVLKNRQATKAKMDRLEARKKAVAEKKKELDDEEEAANGKSKGKKGSDEQPKSGKKSISEMSDAELLAALNRARNEDAYRQLRPEQQSKTGAIKEFMDGAVKPAAMNAGKKFMENALMKLGEKALGEKVDPESVEALKKTWEKMDYKQRIDKMVNPDKYETTAEKRAKFVLEKDKANWNAQMEGKGYTDAADKANKERADAEAAASAKKNNKARVEFISRASGDSDTHRPSTNEKIRNPLKDEIDFTPSKTSGGKSFVDSHGDTLFTFSEKNVDTGRSFIDSYGNSLFTFGDDD